jgi:chemotaxis protein histidine kinase CheA
VSTEPEQTDDAFQKELVELFGQEAQEWLLQIHSSLSELEGQAAPDRHAQVVDTIVRGITSLGGSAATVNLSEVERTTFALLPFIDTIKDRTTASQADYATVREQFRLVIASVTTATGLAFEFDSLSPSDSQDQRAVDLLALLNALRELQEQRTTTLQSPCTLLPQVMRQLEQEARQGGSHIAAEAYQGLVAALQTADEQFLQSLQQELPAVAHHLGRLREEGRAVFDSAPGMATTIEQIGLLQDRAKQTTTTSMVTFLGGLQSFLSILCQRRLLVAGQRLEAVEARIGDVLAMAQEWAAAGRSEREAMCHLLPLAKPS